MNMVVVGKKSLLALFVLGSMRLVAMERDTLQKNENELLVLKWQQTLEDNTIKYRKRFYLKFKQYPLSHEKVREARKQLNFFEKNLSRLNKAIEYSGMEKVGTTIAYNMSMQQTIKQEKKVKHKRFTV